MTFLASIGRRKAPALQLACAVFASCLPVSASDGLVVISKIPNNTEEVSVLSEASEVRIYRSGTPGGTINVAVSCPHDWNVKPKEGTVRQVGFAKQRGGVEMLADSLGSRAIVNGKVYIFPDGPIRGISMGKDGVKVGGQTVQPLAGTDVPGGCKGTDTDDIVEIEFPSDYKGDLTLGLARASSASISDWTGGKLTCRLMGTSSLTAGKLKSLAKAVVDMHGDGKAEISDVSTKVLVVDVTGNGKLNILHGNAEISNATVAGAGSITMKGKFGDLKKSIEGGKGTIQVSE